MALSPREFERRRLARSRARLARRPAAAMPLLLLITAVGAAAMLVPATHALVLGDEALARAFAWPGLLTLVLCWLVGVARSTAVPRRPAQMQLLMLLGAYVALPLVLAVPLVEGIRMPWLAAYAEMVSALTTTGFRFDDPGLIPAPVHLWRGTVAWLGGLLVWVAAAAILAPLNLGGYEVAARGEADPGAAGLERAGSQADPARRAARFAADLAPIYAGLTFVLWLLLAVSGERPFVALMHAMATLSTSGVTPLSGLEEARAGVLGEVIIAAFLVLALSRATFLAGGTGGLRAAVRDAELRLGAALIAAASAFVFLRHYAGAVEGDEPWRAAEAAAAFWGGAFTVLGHLTTTGFHSVHWETAQAWSGLGVPGPLLMGLAMVGGGVATTAGGIKLLRLYALYKHGAREIERLLHPSSVGGSGARARRIRREGARLAWVFFMLFAVALALATLALAAAGIGFEGAMTLAAAALSNTGPLATAAVVDPEATTLGAALGPAARVVLCAAMVLGRLEMLAIVALLNPRLWRG